MDTTPSAAEQVQQLIWSAMSSQVTIALAKLGVPDQLAGGPRPAAAVADSVGADRGALLRLLRAAASIGLLAEADHEHYRLTELGDCLRSDARSSARDRALAFGTSTRWLLMGDLAEAVRTGRSTAPALFGGSIWDHFRAHPDEAEQFSRAMGEQSANTSAAVADVVHVSGDDRIADIGGAHGELLTALLEHAPESSGVLFDTPSVVETARARLERSPLRDRIELVGGDFFAEVPPADLYLVMRVLHDWDDERARQILATCRRACRPGARMVVVELVLPDPWEPSPAHLSDLLMLVLQDGRERTVPEYRAFLADTGWELAEVLPTSTSFTALMATAVDQGEPEHVKETT